MTITPILNTPANYSQRMKKNAKKPAFKSRFFVTPEAKKIINNEINDLYIRKPHLRQDFNVDGLKAVIEEETEDIGGTIGLIAGESGDNVRLLYTDSSSGGHLYTKSSNPLSPKYIEPVNIRANPLHDKGQPYKSAAYHIIAALADMITNNDRNSGKDNPFNLLSMARFQESDWLRERHSGKPAKDYN